MYGLQCGRIYKDAEITNADACQVPPDMLQCGRIYKDAEIVRLLFPKMWSPNELQCGRIYKDAEI